MLGRVLDDSKHLVHSKTTSQNEGKNRIKLKTSGYEMVVKKLNQKSRDSRCIVGTNKQIHGVPIIHCVDCMYNFMLHTGNVHTDIAGCKRGKKCSMLRVQ